MRKLLIDNMKTKRYGLPAAEHKSLIMAGAFPSLPTPLEQEQYQQHRTTTYSLARGVQQSLILAHGAGAASKRPSGN